MNDPVTSLTDQQGQQESTSKVIRDGVNLLTGAGSTIIAVAGVVGTYGDDNFYFACLLLLVLAVASSVLGVLWQKATDDSAWLITLSGLIFLPLASGLVVITGGVDSQLWLLFFLGALSTVAVRGHSKSVWANLVATCIFLVGSMWVPTILERGVLLDDALVVVIRLAATLTAWGVASASLAAMWRALDDRARLEQDRLALELGAQNSLATSLREKETLLKEVHHRVKNNLQVICSLLSMQMHNSTDGAVRELLLESTSRVRSMAFIHELLYSSLSQSRVDFVEYSRRLTAFLATSFRPDAQLEVHADSLPLAVDVAVPCGLILNELVTNALKYGNAPNGTCTVRIEISATATTFSLTVKDEGPGLPEGMEINRTNTLGMQLVQALARQTRASFEVVVPHRGEFRLTVPYRSGEELGEDRA